jgi:NAD(P)-dependent dehydrogenase (short-subunit alcohol dehydrogenase family)
MTWAGRTIAVTGATAGIGAAVREKLLDEGAQVVALDRDDPKDPRVTYVRCDLSDKASIQQAIAQLPDRLDGLANVAGIPGTRPAEAVFRVNFLGLRELTEGVIDRIRPGGAVVNVASIAGAAWQKRIAVLIELVTSADFEAGLKWVVEKGPSSGTKAYDVSKQATILYTKRRSHTAWQRGVRMNAVCPGATTTGILEDFRQSMPEGAIDWSEQALGRHAAPADVAAAVLFLLGPGAAFINGADLPVDGGLVAGVSVGTIDAQGGGNG